LAIFFIELSFSID